MCLDGGGGRGDLLDGIRTAGWGRGTAIIRSVVADDRSRVKAMTGVTKLQPWRCGRRLQPGASVAVIAPSGPVPVERYERGVTQLAARYGVQGSPGLLTRYGFLAGDDGRRLAELRWALSSPQAQAVLCGRGGYGLLRLVPNLLPLIADPLALSDAPLVGFSDITVLHALYALRRQVSIHGPVVTQLGELPAADVAALWALLEDPAPPPPIVDLQPMNEAARRTRAPIGGRLLGGNLEMLSRLCGTPLAAALTPGEPVVLLIEEVGEMPYRIDRALTQLALSGALRDVVALVVGDLVRCQGPADSPEVGAAPTSAPAVIADRAGALGLPAWGNAPLGHGERNRPLPLGVAVELHGRSGQLHFQHGAVR